MNTLSGKRVFVTGATGMIGAHLVSRIVDEGAEVFILVRPNSNTIRINHLKDRISFIEGDLMKPVSIINAIEAVKPDIVFHFASTFFNPPTLSNDIHFKVNVLGTQTLLEALRVFPKVRIVFAGSGSACAGDDGMKETDPLNPSTLFGATKACGTITGQTYAKLYGTSFVELRFFMPFGPWERPGRLIPYTILKALSGVDVDIGNGDQERDFIYIEDAIEATIRAGITEISPGTIINIGSGLGHPVAHVAQLILDLMGNPVDLKIGARETRADEIWKYSADISNAETVLNWIPTTPLKEALMKTIEWYKINVDVASSLP